MVIGDKMLMKFGNHHHYRYF